MSYCLGRVIIYAKTGVKTVRLAASVGLLSAEVIYWPSNKNKTPVFVHVNLNTDLVKSLLKRHIGLQDVMLIAETYMFQIVFDNDQ